MKSSMGDQRHVSATTGPLSLRLDRRAFVTAATMALAGCATLSERRPSPTIDGLSFLPEDLAEISKAGIDAMICDVSEVEEVRDAEGIPRYLRTFARCDAALDAAVARLKDSPLAYVATKGSQIGKREGCAAFLQFQSCEPIESDLTRIAAFHAKGLRVLQFTHHNSNLFAGGALERNPTGLTALGRDGLAEMNRVAILADVAHGSEATMLEAAAASRIPIVYSHGACRAIVDHPRCITDRAIRAIADRGGVVGIFMMSFWLTRDPVPRIEHLIAHIRHVIRVGGIDAVGIANDFPMTGQTNLVNLHNNNAEGVKEYLPWWIAMRDSGIPGFAELPQHVVIPELNNLARMATIRRALENDRFPRSQIDRIMGANWSRILTEVLG